MPRGLGRSEIRSAATVRMSRPDPDAFLGAAYALTAAAYVRVDRKGAVWSAELRPKAHPATYPQAPSQEGSCGYLPRPSDLAAAFEREYAAQRVRWAVARANVPVRGEILKRMLALAEGAPERPGACREALSPEARVEIERLLAEAKAAPQDPLGIATIFEEARWRR